MKNRKWLALLLAVLLLLCCTACGAKKIEEDTEEETAETTEEPAAFPDGTVAYGVDLSGMTPEMARNAMTTAVRSYILTVSAGSDSFALTGTSLGLQLPEQDWDAVLKKCLESSMSDVSAEIALEMDAESLESSVEDRLSEEYLNPASAIIYDPEQKMFIQDRSADGNGGVAASVIEQLSEAVIALEPKLELKAPDAAEIAVPQEVQDALDKANAMLDVELTYSYTPDGGNTEKEKIDRDTIASWLVVGENGLDVDIDQSLLTIYVSSMDEAHSIATATSKFKTSKGDTVDISVPKAGQTVDTTALYNDIYECITTGISGEREAPYVESDTAGLTYDGTYVEIDLTSQHLWYYKDGKLVVESDIVTGCVNTECATPRGVYTIFENRTEVDLIGDDYVSHVKYWMPFNGGIGLHDASWRSSFGGSIYLYSGSHGCVNLPTKAAKTLHENIEVGCHVILYGGKTYVSPLTNSLSGTKSYNVVEGSGSFTLDAAAKYTTDMSYSSNNKKVVTVDENGVVTVVGKGEATITVKAADRPGYTGVTMSVKVTVTDICTANGHSWEETSRSEASCETDGEIVYTCSVCNEKKTETIKATGHQYVDGESNPPTCTEDGYQEQVCAVCHKTVRTTVAKLGHNYENGVCTVCGAKDPDYNSGDSGETGGSGNSGSDETDDDKL